MSTIVVMATVMLMDRGDADDCSEGEGDDDDDSLGGWLYAAVGY